MKFDIGQTGFSVKQPKIIQTQRDLLNGLSLWMHFNSVVTHLLVNTATTLKP